MIMMKNQIIIIYDQKSKLWYEVPIFMIFNRNKYEVISNALIVHQGWYFMIRNQI